jgi:hypothetical protein
MKFATNHHRIQDGDLLAFHGTSCISRLIRLRTASRVTHVGIAVWVRSRGHKVLCVLEAREGYGVRMCPAEEVLRRDRQFVWYSLWDSVEHHAPDGAKHVTKIDRAEIVTFALKQWGKRYASAWQFVRSFSWLTRRVMDWLGFDLEVEPGRFFCSHLVAEALAAGGYRGSNPLEPEEMSPGDIMELACFYKEGTVIL